MMLSGKDRGKSGEVLEIISGGERLAVKGLNLIKKGVRARKQGQKSQIITKERTVSVSSVALVCKACGKPTRVGIRIIDQKTGNKVRFCKKCSAEI